MMINLYLDTTPGLFLNWLERRMSYRGIGRVYDIFAGTNERGFTHSFVLSRLRKLDPRRDPRPEHGEVYVQDAQLDEMVVVREVFEYHIRPISKNRIEVTLAWDYVQGVGWRLLQELIDAYPEAESEFVRWTDSPWGRQEYWAARFDEWWQREKLWVLPGDLILHSVNLLCDLHNAGADARQAAKLHKAVFEGDLKK